MVMVFSMIGLSGCGNDSDVNLICEDKETYNAGNGHDFVLDSDGKTIKQITYKESAHEDFFKKWYPDDDVEYAYSQYKNLFAARYEQIVTGNEELSWMKSKYEMNDESHRLDLTFIFDFTDENFKADDETLEFLKQLNLDRFYDKDEKIFTYDKEKYEASFDNTYVHPVCNVKED